MAEKNKNNLVVNDKTYVKKPEIHYSYKFQPYVKDLGGRPGKNITQEDRNKRLRHESDINAVRNVVKGLNNTFGKAISGAAAFYGGGWALNRLLHLNKPSTLGQFFGRYVLPANTVDNVSDGVELIFDPSIEGAVDLGSGVVLGRFKDLSKPVRLVGELIGQGANINNMKNGGQIRKMLTAAGGPLNLSPEDIKKGANLIGEYFLKGLGAFGKIATAPFRSQGPTSATIYKSKELLAKERTIENKSEELLGKAMTWASPLNYGAALATGNGLNARKGEEEVASWSPAWLALGRAAELYVGPKAVKGVKAAPKAVVNTAAKAGVKPAKAAVIAREIKLATKNKPNLSNRTYTENNGNYTLFSPFGEDIGNLLTTKPLTSEMKGKGISMVASKNKGKRVSEDLYNIAVEDSKMQGYPGLESGHDLFRPKLTMHVTDKFPKIETPNVSLLNINGKWLFAPDLSLPPIRLLTGTSGKPLPNFIQELTNHRIDLETLKNLLSIKFNEITGNFEEVPIKKNIKEPSTSLKFFERKPFNSKLKKSEEAGVPKGERNNVNNSGNLERTVNNIILENEYWLPKETGMFAQKHSSVGSSYRKIFEKLWGKENTDRLTDDLLGKLILIRNHLIDTNIPLKGDFVYVVDGQAKAYRNGLEIGYLNNSYIDNGRALHPEMVKKQGTNNAGVSELLYNGTILAENRPIISGSRLLMPEVTTHIWTKYPTRKLISTEGVHAWPLRTAQERGIKLNYEKNWHTLPEFSKLHQLALDENIRTNLTGLPIYELSEPSYLPMVKNARVFDISLLRDGYINLDFTPGFAYKQGGKMNILEFLKNGGQVRKMQTASGGPIELYNTLWADNWKNRLTSPTVVAKQLTELTSKIPIKYLGGSKDNARKELWKQEPVLQHAVDSISSLYGINPESLKYRLDREGFTDYNIKRRNARIKKGHQQFEPRGYQLLNNSMYKLAGTQIGLDDAKTYIDSGKVKLINENWFDLGTFKNEKGRITYPVEPATLNDGIGIVAAHLKYFRDKALLDFPNASEYDLDRYANAYYNRGAYGGKKWVLAGAKGYNYRKKGGMLELLKNGSGIHIKEKNKGKFTSYCGGKVTDECILKGKNSSNPAIRKRATFADNARHFKHRLGGTVYNGIKKHLEGAKLTFGLKLNNLANSDLGKSFISNGLSFLSDKLSDKLFNKNASSNLEIVLAAQEKELPTIDPMQIAQMIEIARNQYADPDNPNANGGDIFNSYIKRQITAPILAQLEEEHKKRLASIDLLKNQAKSSAVGTFFNTLAQGGIEYLLNKYGKTEKADS